MTLLRLVALILLVVTTSSCHKGPVATTPAPKAAGSGQAASPLQPPAANVPPIRPGDRGRPGVSGVPYPRRTKNVNAIYPREAQQAGAQGMVIIDITVDAAGKVSDAAVTQSIPLLDRAALEAVRQWEYTPSVVDGKPVPVIMTVTVNFTLQ